MNRVKRIDQAKEKVQKVKNPLTVILPPEERLRILANLIIDRIFEAKVKGLLPTLEKKE